MKLVLLTLPGVCTAVEAVDDEDEDCCAAGACVRLRITVTPPPSTEVSVADSHTMHHKTTKKPLRFGGKFGEVKYGKGIT